MNILVYIPDLSQTSGGLRQYSIALIRVLMNDKVNKYYIYVKNNDPEVIQLVNNHLQLNVVNETMLRSRSMLKNKNRVKALANSILKTLKPGKQLRLVSEFDQLLRQFSIGVVHCPYQFLPQTNAVKLVTTLHDVQEIHFPEYFTPEVRAYRAVNYLEFLSRADVVVVSYNHVKADIVKYFGINPAKIKVVLLEMDKLWFTRFQSGDNFSTGESSKPFLLYPANTWKHKNHVTLLQAVAMLRDVHNVAIDLVCTGDKSEFYQLEIEPLLRQLNLAEHVKFIGIVDEQTLYTLYKTCRGVVVPTLYEAGSFPLMESILLRVPVICSNVTSLPETIDNPDFFFDPRNVGQMAEKIKTLWESESFRTKSVENSDRVAGRIINTGAFEKLQELYRQLEN